MQKGFPRVFSCTMKEKKKQNKKFIKNFVLRRRCVCESVDHVKLRRAKKKCIPQWWASIIIYNFFVFTT